MFTVPENVENTFTELGYCVYNVPFDGECAFAAIKYKYKYTKKQYTQKWSTHEQLLQLSLK